MSRPTWNRSLWKYYVLVAVAFPCAPVAAATITVTEQCTLVNAVHSANTDSPVGGCVAGDLGTDTIELAVDVLLTEIDNTSPEGPNGLPLVTSSIELEGRGFEIKRENFVENFRLFVVDSGAALTISETTIRNARLSKRMQTGGQGGAIFVRDDGTLIVRDSLLFGNAGYIGGAIFTDGEVSVEVSNTEFRNNSALFGGAIAGSVTVEDCLFEDNHADFDAGAINAGVATIRNTTFTGNSADRSGGAVDAAGSVFIEDSLFEANIGTMKNSYSDGGAINVAGYARIERSAFIDNEASFRGGAIEVDAGTMVLLNSTLSGNSALEQGSAIDIRSYYFTTSRVHLDHVTIADNRDEGAFLSSRAITAFLRFGDELTIENSILGENDLDNCSIGGAGIFTAVNSLADDSTCLGIPEGLTGLDPIARMNGGFTPTHSLTADSTARDAHPDCDFATDQRLVLRDDGACDLGAFERSDGPPPELLVAGTCPGRVSISVTGATPSAIVSFLASDQTGSFVKPQPPCEGTTIGLTSPSLVNTLAADLSGAVSFSADLEDGSCGRFLQAIDGGSCLPSEVATLPE